MFHIRFLPYQWIVLASFVWGALYLTGLPGFAKENLPLPTTPGTYVYDWAFSETEPRLVRLEPPQGNRYTAERVSATKLSILLYHPRERTNEWRLYRAVRPGFHDGSSRYELSVTRRSGSEAGLVILEPQSTLRRGEYWIGNPVRRINYGAFYVYDNP